MKVKLILGICILFLIIGCNNLVVEENNTNEIDKEWEQFYVCERSMEVVNNTKFDLIKDYNLTCKKIDFIINNWVSQTNRELKSSGLFSSEYEEVDYGVHKSIQLKRTVTVLEPTISNCPTYKRINTDIYLREHFVDYYIENCIKEYK